MEWNQEQEQEQVDVDVDGQSEVRPITTEIRIESLEPSKLATAFG